MERIRRGVIATLLLALAAASALATISILNITEWTVKAQGSPIVKVAGSDAATRYVNVTWYTARDGTNRTLITVVGFKGDPTTYTSVLRVCNYNFSGSVSVSLVYKGLVYGDWTYVKYIRILYPDGNPLHIDSTTPPGASLSLGTIGPGACSDDIGVEVLVTPDAPTKQPLITIEIDVEATWTG